MVYETTFSLYPSLPPSAKEEENKTKDMNRQKEETGEISLSLI
jgi:hypothetical protein